MSTTATRPKVGVAVFVMKDDKFIMTHRSGAHGADTWGLPGGHLEFGESWADCAARETREEVGLEIQNVRFLAVTNDVFAAESKHYVTIFMIADWASGVEQNMEPDKCQELGWFTYSTLPENIFLPIQTLRATYPTLHV